MIRKDIYNISLCQNIYDGRRRLIYKDCFNEFDTNIELYSDINKWVARYRNNKVLTKISMINKKLSICGELDMIDLTENNEKIIEFKCSLNSDYKLEWIIQLMIYSALYQSVHDKTINIFCIYNPLRGTMTDIDIGAWDKHKELLIYMDCIRTKRMTNK
jgi:hypothetical protein